MEAASVLSTNELDKRFDLFMSPWRLQHVGKSENDSLPLDFGVLEIDQETNRPARGSQIIQTLCGVLLGKPFGTFQFHHQHVLYQQIREIVSYRIPLVHHGQRGFCGSTDASEAQLSHQGTLVNLLEESRTQRVGDLEHGAQDPLAQRIQECAIGVHRRSSAADTAIGADTQKLYAADEHRQTPICP